MHLHMNVWFHSYVGLLEDKPCSLEVWTVLLYTQLDIDPTGAWIPIARGWWFFVIAHGPAYFTRPPLQQASLQTQLGPGMGRGVPKESRDPRITK